MAGRPVRRVHSCANRGILQGNEDDTLTDADGINIGQSAGHATEVGGANHQGQPVDIALNDEAQRQDGQGGARCQRPASQGHPMMPRL